MSDKKILGEIGDIKKKNYTRLADENYLEANDLERAIRFDVISIIHNNNKTKIEYFISAF